ncbi:MAG: hypothetical protein SXA11_09340 [Cyanobacteriota bacterium]|nr:hypothetical protein [Cyanobacteriota bacterium]
MNKLFSWRTLALVLLVVVSVGGPITFSQPSTATSSNYQQMIELGIIDEVIEPEDLGLDYLHQRPPQLISLLGNMRTAQGKYQETGDIEVAIPLGLVEPVGVGQLTSDNGVPSQAINASLEAIGSLTPSGQAEGTTAREAANMIAEEERRGGTLDDIATLDNRETLVADASNILLQTRRVKVLDLIVRDRRTNRFYLLPRVRADSFCRDVINAGVRGLFSKNQINLRNLRPRRL